MRYLLIILCLSLASPAFADRGGGGNGRDGGPDHDRARSAVVRHQILPLERVIAQVRRTTGGRVIEVELEQKAGRYYYELKLITAHGRIVEIEVDAATGVIADGSGKQNNRKDD